jgi:NAD(P)-dependent dehydrogenase (short-subunit alcohol dehydrogenase family)
LTPRLGGASGIGLGITRHFITQLGTHITILDVNITSGAQVLQQLQTEFPSASVSFEQCDVSSWESQAAAFEKIYAQQGRVDIVFANAGISKEGNLLPAKGDAAPVKPNLTTMNVNLVGVIYSKRDFEQRFTLSCSKRHEQLSTWRLIICIRMRQATRRHPRAG